MSLDHGILNTPLSKRGDIDRQLDAHKVAQARAAAAKRKVDAAAHRAAKAVAKASLVEIKAAPGLLEMKAAELGVTKATLVNELESSAKWEPAKVISLHKQWLPEGA